ncbi:hypothetical protein CF121_12275 [Aeromonas media]|nr:hypothetical protein CF121_12275 [Aeromonas media]
MGTRQAGGGSGVTAALVAALADALLAAPGAAVTREACLPCGRCAKAAAGWGCTKKEWRDKVSLR